MRAVVVLMSVALLCAAQPALVQGQSATSASAGSIVETPHRTGSRTIPQRLAAQRVLVGGIATLVGVWLANAAITALASLFFYLEGTRAPCLPGLCGYEALFASPLVPIVGSAMWSSLILESPPLGETWPATFGILAMLGQQVGLSMIIAGASDLSRPIDWGLEGFVTRDGARLGVRGRF